MILDSGKPRASTLLGLADWLQRQFAIVRGAWNVQHGDDGYHRFPWVDIEYRATLFAGSSGMTWGVANTDVQTYQYMRIGDTVWLQWAIVTSDCSGGQTELRLELPTNLTPVATRSAGTHWYIDAGGTGAVGRALIVDGETFVRLEKVDRSNWTNTTADNTRTEGSILYRVAPVSTRL